MEEGIALKLTVNGVHLIEGELEELVEFLARFEERRRGVPINLLAGDLNGGSSSTTRETLVEQNNPNKPKWKSRFRPERHDTSHTEQERKARVVTALTELAKTDDPYLVGKDIGQAVGISDLRGLGALVKDMAGFLAKEGFEPNEVVSIVGQNPRRYYPGPKIGAAIAALNPPAGGC